MQEVTKLSPYCAKLFSDLNPLMLMDEELYLEEIDKNGEKQEKRVGQITSIGINYPALAFTIKGGEQIYFIDQYKFASIDGGLISFDELKAEIKKLSADDFEAKNENEFMNSLTLNLRRDKYIEKHKGVFLEYENISFDFHDRIRSQLKFLKFKFDDEYTVNRKYDVSDSKHIKTDNSSKSKFTVYF